MIFDSHCHLQFKGFDKDRDDVIARCKEKSASLNIVGTQKETSKKAVELAEQHDHFYATIGVHPTHLFPTRVVEEESDFVSREENFDEEFFSDLATSKKVIGVGETGLDFFHLPKDKTKEEVLEKQREVFLQHAAFAHRQNLPLVIHCRDAHDEMVETLQSVIVSEQSERRNPSHNDFDEGIITSPIAPRNDSGISGVMHCYTGDWKYANIYLEMGLYLGFTGVITFPPKKTNPKEQLDLLEVVKKCPLDRMLVETDAPFLAPQKFRGKRSEPWMIEENIQKIAEIKSLPSKEVREQLLKNTHTLFNSIHAV